jgi:hypothetical protein
VTKTPAAPCTSLPVRSPQQSSRNSAVAAPKNEPKTPLTPSPKLPLHARAQSNSHWTILYEIKEEDFASAREAGQLGTRVVGHQLHKAWVQFRSPPPSTANHRISRPTLSPAFEWSVRDEAGEEGQEHNKSSAIHKQRPSVVHLIDFAQTKKNTPRRITAASLQQITDHIARPGSHIPQWAQQSLATSM